MMVPDTGSSMTERRSVAFFRKPLVVVLPNVDRSPEKSLLAAALNVNCALLDSRVNDGGVLLAAVTAPSVHTVVVSFEPLVPPSRSMWRTGLLTGLLKTNVKVSAVPKGFG